MLEILLQLIVPVVAYPYFKNHHNSSIQSCNIEDLILRITFEGPGEPDHTAMNGQNQGDIFLYA